METTGRIGFRESTMRNAKEYTLVSISWKFYEGSRRALGQMESALSVQGCV